MPIRFATGIDQRAARVAWIDGCVGLDEVLILLDIQAASSGGTDDSHRDRLANAEGISDCEGKSPTAGTALRSAPRVSWAVDFQYGNVCMRIGTDALWR